MKLLYMAILLLPFSVYAQVTPHGYGFSSFSGENGVATSDAFSLMNNPATMVKDSLLIGLSAHSIFSEEGLYHFIISSQIPTKFTNLGFGVHRYGDELANETTVSIGASKLITEDISIGVSILYFSAFAQFANTKSTIYPQIGVAYDFSENLKFGFSARNPFSQDLAEPFDQNLQSFFTAGLSFRANEKFSTTLQADVWETYGLGAGLGVKYQFIDNIILSLGGKTDPGLLTAGIIVQMNSFSAGVGGKQQQSLGVSPQAVFQSTF